MATICGRLVGARSEYRRTARIRSIKQIRGSSLREPTVSLISDIACHILAFYCSRAQIPVLPYPCCIVCPRWTGHIATLTTVCRYVIYFPRPFLHMCICSTIYVPETAPTQPEVSELLYDEFSSGPDSHGPAHTYMYDSHCADDRTIDQGKRHVTALQRGLTLIVIGGCPQLACIHRLQSTRHIHV